MLYKNFLKKIIQISTIITCSFILSFSSFAAGGGGDDKKSTGAKSNYYYNAVKLINNNYPIIYFIKIICYVCFNIMLK